MIPTTLKNRELINFGHELKKLNASEEVILATMMFFEQLESRVDSEDQGFVAVLEAELAERESESYALRERIAELSSKRNDSLNERQLSLDERKQQILEDTLTKVSKENQALKEKIAALDSTKREEDLLKELEDLRKFKKVFRYLVNEVNK